MPMKTPIFIKIAVMVILPLTAISAECVECPCREYIDSSTQWKSGPTTVTLADSGTTLRVSGKGAMADYAKRAPWSFHLIRKSSVSSVIIEDGVTYIGVHVFAKPSGIMIPVEIYEPITSVTIPNSVTSIGKYAFWGCDGLTSVTIPNSVTSIGASAFAYCRRLTSVTIPSGITSIEPKTFYACFDLTSATIPSSVTSIGDSAFAETSLISVTIPNKVTSIGNWMFAYCTKLVSITIPNKVTSIGKYPFLACKNLVSVTCLNPTPPKIEKTTFATINDSACFYVPANSINAYRAADVWQQFKCIKPIESAP